jgi:hypothetical protein
MYTLSLDLKKLRQLILKERWLIYLYLFREMARDEAL